jgi:hypothetical protein
MDLPFAVFPQAAGFVKPSESALNNPSLRQNHEFMQFIALDNFNFDVFSKQFLHLFWERLTIVTPVNQKFFHGRQSFRVQIYHVKRSCTVAYVSGCHENSMGQSHCVNHYMTLYS